MDARLAMAAAATDIASREYTNTVLTARKSCRVAE